MTAKHPLWLPLILCAAAAVWGAFVFQGRSAARGALVAREPEFTLKLRAARGASVAEGHGGRARLPAGRYLLEDWSARMRDSRGRSWEIRRAAGEPARVVRVRADGDTPLPLAAPVEPDLVIEQSGSEVSFRLRLKGAGGETCGPVSEHGRMVPPPALRVTDARGRVIARLKGEGGCGDVCAQSWRPPPGLAQPLTAIPEADLGPFPLTATTFRFRLQEHPHAAGYPRSGWMGVGQPAPDFALRPSEGGAPLRLSSLRGRPVILGFFCGCGLCQAAARRVGREAAALNTHFLAIVESERQLRPDRVERFRQAAGLTGPLLADPGGAVTRRYGAVTCPRFWAIDAHGVARYTNASHRAAPEALARGIRRALTRGEP